MNMETLFSNDISLALDIDELGVLPFDKIPRDSIDDFLPNEKTMDLTVYPAELQFQFQPHYDNSNEKETMRLDNSDDDDDDGNNEYDIDPETGEKIFREGNFISNLTLSSSSPNDKWIEEYLLNIESSSANLDQPTTTTTTTNSSFLFENLTTENLPYQTDSDWFSNLLDLDEMVTDSMLSNEYLGDNSIPLPATTTTISQPMNIPLLTTDEDYSTSSSSDQQRSYSSTENIDEITLIETKLEKIDHEIEPLSQILDRRSSTRSISQVQSDDDILRQYDIPLTYEEITQSSTEEYNRHLARLTHLKAEQIHVIKDIRRRGKNKIAAQNCRKRKLIGVESLVDEVDELKRMKQELEERKRLYEQQIAETRQQYEYLHRQVLPDHQLPPAIIVK